MIFDRIRDGFCRAICPFHSGHHKAGEDRLERAELLHVMSAQSAKIENKKTGRQVGYMRTVANSAVDRLRHDRMDDGEAES